MFNIAVSVRPVTILPEPVVFKGNLYQMAIVTSVPLSDKDEPLVTAILNPLESNQSQVIGEYFKAISELPQAEQEGTYVNVGGLAWATDHYRIGNKEEANVVYTDAMEPFTIPAELLGAEGDALYPDIVLFTDTAIVGDESTVQSYYSMDCGFIKTYQSQNDERLSHKLQSRGPTLDDDLPYNSSFYVSANKTVQRELERFQHGDTASAAVSGNVGAYIGQDGTAKIRFSVSRMFIGKIFDKGGQVQRETMKHVQFTKQENAAIASLRSRLGRVTAEVVSDDF